jgi:hypothetical protein
VDELVIARNPEEGSTLPFLVRLPLGRDGVVLKVRETWPRTAKVYCHPVESWPADPDIVEGSGPVLHPPWRRHRPGLARGRRTAPSSCSPGPAAGR